MIYKKAKSEGNKFFATWESGLTGGPSGDKKFRFRTLI